METKKITVELPKEGHELADGIADIAITALKATEDGWQTGQDLPVVVTSTVAELPTMVDGLDQLDEEFTASKDGFILAWLLAGQKVFKEIEARKARKDASAEA